MKVRRPTLPQAIDKYDVATEVLGSALRVLQAVGFSEKEASELFRGVAEKHSRAPVWIFPPE